MRFYISLFLLLSFIRISAQRDTVPEKPKQKIFISGGLSFSAINFLRNENDRVPKPGFHAKVDYAFENLWIGAEYTRSFIFSSRTWKNVRSQNYDLNCLLTANVFDPRAKPFAIVGAGIHDWRAEFTGEQDYHNWRKIHDPGEKVRELWPVINLGAGYLKYWEHSGFRADFRFRLSDSELGFNISDVCYTFSYIFLPSKKFLEPNRIYKWF